MLAPLALVAVHFVVSLPELGLICLGVLVAAAGLCYGIGFFTDRRDSRKRCPRCSDGRLETRNSILATCVDENGRRYPDAWKYCECDRCDARLKIFLNGKIEDPSDEEWSSHCQREGVV